MLAAASAWRILEAEHTRLRQLLAAVARVLEAGGWQQGGPQLAVLSRAIGDFQAFETAVHQPKGVVLLQSLRGRSVEADAWLDRLDRESAESDQLLAQAVALVATLAQGGAADTGSIALLLQRHRDVVMQQLEEEDTILRDYTSQLLTPQEWSAVVSSMSTVVQKAKARRAG